MTEAILAELDAVEQQRDVRVVYALESGSRCWGFASADSDYDVRFVYARPKNDYLKLEKVRDTIEWRLDDELDIVGWDVAKFLRLMRSSNPTAFEWLSSTIVYREDPCFQLVRDVASACFDPVSHAHHYLGMATREDVRYLSANKASLKRYLYAVRALLSARWVIEECSPAPMAFEDLCTAKLDPTLGPLVEDVVAQKRLGSEVDMCGHIQELDRWIANAIAFVEERLASMESRERIPWSVLNNVFVELLDGASGI